jgi:hypothetical protein
MENEIEAMQEAIQEATIDLVKKRNKLRERLATNKKNQALLTASNAESMADLQQRVENERDSAEPGANITQNSMGFTTSDSGFLGFLYGLMGGPSAFDIELKVKAFWQLLKQYTVGLMPKEAWRLNEAMVGEVNGHMQRGKFITKQLQQAIKEDGLRQEEVVRDLDAALKSPDLLSDTPLFYADGTEISGDVRAHLVAMRNTLTNSAIRSSKQALRTARLWQCLPRI